MYSEIYRSMFMTMMDLFYKVVVMWFIASVVFVSLWALVRGIQKHRARAKVIWAIGFGCELIDDIVLQTHLSRDEVEEVMEDLKTTGVVGIR